MAIFLSIVIVSKYACTWFPIADIPNPNHLHTVIKAGSHVVLLRELQLLQVALAAAAAAISLPADVIRD